MRQICNVLALTGKITRFSQKHMLSHTFQGTQYNQSFKKRAHASKPSALKSRVKSTQKHLFLIFNYALGRSVKTSENFLKNSEHFVLQQQA
jgi:hypothetical protein